MPSAAPDNGHDVFNAARPRLFAMAYRMLGTRADAEDIVQDAWLRWHATDQTSLKSSEAWLVTIVTRLAIDRLRAAKVEREAYVGWWLPEPLVTHHAHTPETIAEQTDELSVAVLWVLERLSPDERAAFLLKQVFDHGYDDIAKLLGKTETACRQLVHRANGHVHQEQRRFDVPKDAHRRLLQKFMHAAQNSERSAMQALLADDVEVVSDGGGKVPSFAKILHGTHRIANLYWAISRRTPEAIQYRMVQINGEAGLLRYVDGQLESAQAFATDGERILRIYTIRNPDKLAAIERRALIA